MHLPLSNPKLVSINPAASTSILKSNPYRTSIIVTNANNATDMVVWTDPALNVDRGIYVPPKFLPVVIDGAVWGDMVTREWFAFTNAFGAVIITVVEILDYSQNEQGGNNVPFQSDTRNSGRSRQCYTASKQKSNRPTFQPTDCERLLSRLRLSGGT